MNLTLPVVTLAAIIDSINPCAISVLLLTIGFLISLNKNRRQIFVIAGFYILGIFITYVMIGLGVLRALTFFGISQAISKFGAIILLVVGIINLLGSLIPDFPIKLVIPSLAKPGIAKLMSKSSIPAAFAMGIIVGLFEFPCTGGPYLLILSLLHDRATVTTGALYLLYYNLIFISPLVAILVLGSNPVVSNRVQTWRKSNSKSMDIISSLAMIILGIVIFLL
jgi:cytochrome c-type biogenesis protein